MSERPEWLQASRVQRVGHNLNDLTNGTRGSPKSWLTRRFACVSPYSAAWKIASRIGEQSARLLSFDMQPLPGTMSIKCILHAHASHSLQALRAMLSSPAGIKMLFSIAEVPAALNLWLPRSMKAMGGASQEVNSRVFLFLGPFVYIHIYIYMKISQNNGTPIWTPNPIVLIIGTPKKVSWLKHRAEKLLSHYSGTKSRDQMRLQCKWQAAADEFTPEL